MKVNYCRTKGNKKIIKEYYEKPHANNLDNRSEMEKFVETLEIPILPAGEVKFSTNVCRN